MRKSVLLALAVACAAHIPAQTARDGRVALSLADAVDMALERNVTIARNTISLGTNERAKSHAWNSISPSAHPLFMCGVNANSCVVNNASASPTTARLGICANPCYTVAL